MKMKLRVLICTKMLLPVILGMGSIRLWSADNGHCECVIREDEMSKLPLSVTCF